MSQGTVSRGGNRQDVHRDPTVSQTVSQTVSDETVSQTVNAGTRTVTVADVAAAAKGEEADSQEVEYDGPPPFRVSFAEAGEQLRFVSRSPGSLLDQIEYAREGAYTHRVNGPWRAANIVFAKYIAVPGLGLCYLLGWSLFTRLSRALTCGPLFVLLFILLNRIPVTHWLGHEVLDLLLTWWG